MPIFPDIWTPAYRSIVSIACADYLGVAGASAGYAGKLAELYDAINAGRMGCPPGSGAMRRGAVTLDEVLRRLST